VYLVVSLMFLPIRFALYAASQSFHFDTSRWQAGIQPFNVLKHCAFFIPLLWIGFLRFLSPNYATKIFLKGIEISEPKLANEIRSYPIQPFVDYIYGFAKRMLWISLMGLLIFVWSKLPFIGWLAIPVAQFFLTKKAFGTPAAAILAMIGLIPQAKPYATYFVEIWMASVALGRELLDPYMCRVKREDQIYMINRYMGWFIGFSLPFAILLSIPFLSLFGWAIAQSSAAFLLIGILQTNAMKRDARLLPGQNFVSLEKSDVPTEKEL